MGGVSEFEASLIFIVSSRTARMKLCLEKKQRGRREGEVKKERKLAASLQLLQSVQSVSNR